MSRQHDQPTVLVVGIAQIPDEGLRLQVDLAADTLPWSQVEEVAFATPVRVQGRLTRAAEQIYFQGTVHGITAIPCSRCLETTYNDFVVDMCVVFLPLSSVETEDEEAPDISDEIDLYLHDGFKLDLWPAVHDQVMLALPIQPLCRTDCAGLCQVCGGNLNEAQCGCQIEDGDPRFALLKHLSFPQSS